MISELLLKKRFFRPDEVAELLLVTKRTVYRMVHDGRLGEVDLTKRPCRIPREAVISLFETESNPQSALPQSKNQRAA